MLRLAAAIPPRKFATNFLMPFTTPSPCTRRCANQTNNAKLLRWANDQANRTEPRAGQRKQQMTTWKYQLFVISVGAQAGADVAGHQGLEDELNDLGQQGWELTAVTDAVTPKSSSSNSRTKRT